MYPKTYKTADGSDVTVLSFVRSRFNDEPCYRVVLSGSVDAFFSTDVTIPSILSRTDFHDRTVIDYRPSDSQFAEYAEALDRIGEWH